MKKLKNRILLEKEDLAIISHGLETKEFKDFKEKANDIGLKVTRSFVNRTITISRMNEDKEEK